jgi:hypothetical protein
MSNHIVAKQKVRTLASRIEKSLYKLKYGGGGHNILDDRLYSRISNICIGEGMPFPLVKHNREIYLDITQPELYHILSKLADNHQIILNYEKTYR